MKLKGLYLILIMTICTALMAQDKYEHAVVSQIAVNNITYALSITIEGQPYKKNKLSGSDFDGSYDLSPLLKQIALMRNDGWEVWNTSTVSVGFGLDVTYFLRRKLK